MKINIIALATASVLCFASQAFAMEEYPSAAPVHQDANHAKFLEGLSEADQHRLFVDIEKGNLGSNPGVPAKLRPYVWEIVAGKITPETSFDDQKKLFLSVELAVRFFGDKDRAAEALERALSIPHNAEESDLTFASEIILYLRVENFLEMNSEVIELGKEILRLKPQNSYMSYAILETIGRVNLLAKDTFMSPAKSIITKVTPGDCDYARALSCLAVIPCDSRAQVVSAALEDYDTGKFPTSAAPTFEMLLCNKAMEMRVLYDHSLVWLDETILPYKKLRLR
jgi:hypothetical protein